MAGFPLDPKYFNVAGITAKQADSASTDIWPLREDFAAWVTVNLPVQFFMVTEGCWISIPDERGDVIMDYLQNWA